MHFNLVHYPKKQTYLEVLYICQQAPNTFYIPKHICSSIQIMGIKCSIHFHGHMCKKKEALWNADCFYKHQGNNMSVWCG